MPDDFFSKELIFIYFCTKQKKNVQLFRKPLKEPNLLLRNVVEVALTIVL